MHPRMIAFPAGVLPTQLSYCGIREKKCVHVAGKVSARFPFKVFESRSDLTTRKLRKTIKLKIINNKPMNTLQKITRRFGKTLAMAALLLGLGLGQAEAAKIKMEVKVAGYSTAGWILVVPELRSTLGGKVRFIAEYGCYVTDRVQRGETMRLTISASTATERCQKGAWTGVVSLSDPNQLFTIGAVTLPYVNTAKVTTNPLADEVYAYAITSAGTFAKRVPIGTR